MAEEKVEVRDINYRQVMPWTELFRSFQVALDPKKLLLAGAGILAMAFGWWLLALVFFTQPPQWKAAGGDYEIDKYRPKDAGGRSVEELNTIARENAWKAFKDDRRKWDILNGAAGTGPLFTDAGDLANSPDEYEAIKADVEKSVKELAERGEKKRIVNIGGKDYLIRVKPYGKLRTWPFFEDRGPNPYLMVTGQAGTPWEAGHFGQWLVTDESQVLIEPLVKFLYPVVYLIGPRTGGLNRLYFLLVTLWTLATWALFGGAITRMAAVQIARNDKIGMSEAIRFVTQRYVSFLSAPIFPLLFVAFMVVLLIIYGLFFMIPVVGDIVVAGLGWPLVFLAGLAMAVVLVGLVGWPMMYATISAEGSDSFDAISRSYSYVYQSPWHYIWYSLVAIAYGAVVVFFVGFMGSLIVYLGKWGVSQTFFIESANREPSFLFVYAPTSFGWRTLLLQGATVDGQSLVENGTINEPAYRKLTGQDPAYKGPDRMSWWNQVGAVLVTAWLYLFFLLILGFGYSYFWSASTITYLLMRRKVDDTDMDEVYLEEDEAEESYSASTTVSAPPAPPPPATSPVTMVEAPTLRSSAPPPSSAISEPKPEPKFEPKVEPKVESHVDPEPAPSSATAPTATSDGNPASTDGAGS
ncbi:MAG: hypothetical protein K2R98_04305 [Gemmataceae bacterium]|nr:hypothetical protein [Gemmataceae bacterium]